MFCSAIGTDQRHVRRRRNGAKPFPRPNFKGSQKRGRALKIQERRSQTPPPAGWGKGGGAAVGGRRRPPQHVPRDYYVKIAQSDPERNVRGENGIDWQVPPHVATRRRSNMTSKNTF